MRERNDSQYEQFEISPETIEQELWYVDSKQRQTGVCKAHYNIDMIDLFSNAYSKVWNIFLKQYKLSNITGLYKT